MRSRNKRMLWTVVALVTVGCARSEYPFSGQARPNARPVSDPSMRNVEEEKPPKILPDTHYAAAMLFEKQGQVDKAIVQYRKTVALNHNHAGAYHRLGLMLSATGQHDEALSNLRRAAELRPDSSLIQSNLGFEHMLVQNWDSAEDALRRAIELQPDMQRAHVNLGMVLARTGRFEDALAAFQQVLPEPDAYYNLGLMLRGQKQYDDAAAAFRQVLALNPGFSAAGAQLEQIETKIESSRLPAPTDTLALAIIPEPQTEPRPVEAIVPESVEPALEVEPVVVEEEPIDVFALLRDLVGPKVGDGAPARETVEAAPEEPAAVEVVAEIEPLVPTTGEEFIEESDSVPAPTIEAVFAAEEFVEETEPVVEADAPIELDADEVIALVPADVLTRPAGLLQSWTLMEELEAKIALLRGEMAMRPCEPTVEDVFAAPTFELPMVPTDDTPVADAPVQEDPQAEPLGPTGFVPVELVLPVTEDAAIVEGNPAWSATFGELESILAVVVNESRCWGWAEIETAEMSDEATDPNSIDLSNDDEDVRVAWPMNTEPRPSDEYEPSPR